MRKFEKYVAILICVSHILRFKKFFLWKVIQDLISAYSIICNFKETAKKRKLAYRKNYRIYGISAQFMFHFIEIEYRITPQNFIQNT